MPGGAPTPDVRLWGTGGVGVALNLAGGGLWDRGAPADDLILRHGAQDAGRRVWCAAFRKLWKAVRDAILWIFDLL